MRHTHRSWDTGIVARAIAEHTGEAMYADQKETRTACGGKVIVGNINDNNFTCPACLEVTADAAAFGEVVLNKIASFCVFRPIDYTLLTPEFQAILAPYYVNALSEKALKDAA